MDILVIGFIVFFIINIIIHVKILKKSTFIDDIKNPIFVISFIIMIGFSIWAYTVPGLKYPTQHALIAYATAYLAHLDLIFSAFILSWLIVYVSNKLDIDKIPIIKLYNNYFGSGMSSIVFQEIREAKALAYSVSSRYTIPSNPKDFHYLIASIGTQADKLNEAIKSILNFVCVTY